MTTTAPQPVEVTGEIIAAPGRYYRNARYLLAVVLIVFGALCIRDGFVKWPRENAAVLEGNALPHKEMDIRLNQVMGVGLPLLAIAMLAWCLYNSRGRHRLAGQTLHAPGHSPVSFQQIRLLDKRLWDRKGIAYVEYDLPGRPRPRRLRLDDFVYDAIAIREIVKRIEEHLKATPNP